MTGRSGQATAAPTAFGRPWPIAPPVSVSRSWRGAPAVIVPSIRPEVIASSTTMARSGSRWPTALQTLAAVRRPRGRGGRAAGCSAGVGLRRAQRGGELVQAGGGVLRRRGQHVHGAALRHQVAGLAGIGEERHRRFGIDQDQVLDAGELQRGQFGQVGDALHRRQAGAAFQSGREDLAEQCHAALRGDARGGQQRRFAQRLPAQQQRGLAAAADRAARWRQRWRRRPAAVRAAAGAGRACRRRPS